MPDEQRNYEGQLSVAASAAWAALQKNAIPATPANYELFYAHFSSAHPELSRGLDPLLSGGQPVTSDMLNALYDQFIATTDMETMSEGADAIAEAAQGLVEQVKGGQEAIGGYSRTLAHWTGRLDGQTTVDELLRAVTALTAETVRASERNRALESELSASAVRINKLRQHLVEVRQEATTDTLTGIANRKAFEAKLRRAVAQARSDPSTTFSLLMVDVDHFKRFNDAHGHRTGDHVLRLVARSLTDNVKGRDTAARYGGEEFAILLVGADLKAGAAVGRQICERLSAYRLVKRGTGEPIGQVTVSIGVAQHRPGEGGTGLVERADGALYTAKDAGRNRVCVAS